MLLQHNATSHVALWADFSKLGVVLGCLVFVCLFAVILPSL